MAMSRGGVLVIGVTDQRRLVGRSLDQETLDRVASAAYEAGVEVDVRAITVGGTPITLVVVPAVRDRIVTTSDGRLLRRVGRVGTDFYSRFPNFAGLERFYDRWRGKPFAFGSSASGAPTTRGS